ncbi:uncharacterized protein LOC112555291 isoform X1 [Pomacea canaliculata]|uniref:uncharacterized protein LOC112555291 isoform X1 n=1 Tax=Pomacea canaliculata TaxID=400727 RepID=UPI000D72952C|nr:uncharacterized protein LOC112555291 isoform X1 [Pomacea canaliculata]
MGLLHSLAFPKQDEKDKPKPLIIDVEEVLKEAAWDMYIHSYGPLRRQFIKRKNFTIEVPMNYYHFEQGPPKIRVRHVGQTRHNLSTDTDGAQQGVQEGRGVPEMIGLETRFNNDTETEQKYNFNFQKERSASVEVTYQRGFSIGGKANFTLGVPKITAEGKVGIEIETHVEVTKTTGERHEERVTTSATSEITVAPHSHYTATVVMEERSLVADFEIPVTMTLPAERGLIYIKMKETGEVVYVQNVTNLPFYFHKFDDVQIVNANGEVVGKTKEFYDQWKDIRFKIVGIVNGVQLSSHCINLRQTGVVPAGSNLASASPKVSSRESKGKALLTAPKGGSGVTTTDVASSSSAQDPVRSQGVGDQILQVASSADASAMEGVQKAIVQQAKDSGAVHVPGRWLEF